MSQKTIYKIKTQLPKKILIGIQTMKKIQIKEDKFEQSFKNTQKLGGFCQLSDYCLQVLDKSLVENKKRCDIWNDIRNCIVTESGHITLWQFGLKSQLNIKCYGKEDILNFNTKQLEKILELK